MRSRVKPVICCFGARITELSFTHAQPEVRGGVADPAGATAPAMQALCSVD